jgi:hypothetical protein
MGAALGGITSAVTGGDIGQGMALGAAGGALTGGITGAMSPAAASGVGMSARNMPTDLAPMPRAAGLGAAAPGGAPAAAPGLATAAPAAAAPTGFGAFLQNPIVGQAAAGIGKGLIAGMAAKEDAAALKDEQRRLTQSYDIDPSVYDQSGAAVAQPQEAPRRPRYHYDRDARRVVYG